MTAVPLGATTSAMPARSRRDDVHIAFDDDQAPGGAAGRAGAVEVVEGAALVEEGRVGRVEILRLALAKDAAAEGDHPPARVADRDHQAAAEAVVGVLVAFVGLDQHAGVDQLVLAEVGERGLELVRPSGARPMPKRVDGRGVDAALPR